MDNPLWWGIAVVIFIVVFLVLERKKIFNKDTPGITTPGEVADAAKDIGTQAVTALENLGKHLADKVHQSTPIVQANHIPNAPGQPTGAQNGAGQVLPAGTVTARPAGIQTGETVRYEFTHDPASASVVLFGPGQQEPAMPPATPAEIRDPNVEGPKIADWLIGTTDNFGKQLTVGAHPDMASAASRVVDWWFMHPMVGATKLQEYEAAAQAIKQNHDLTAQQAADIKLNNEINSRPMFQGAFPAASMTTADYIYMAAMWGRFKETTGQEIQTQAIYAGDNAPQQRFNDAQNTHAGEIGTTPVETLAAAANPALVTWVNNRMNGG